MAPRGSQQGSVHPCCPPSDCGWSREGFLGTATLLGGLSAGAVGGEAAGWLDDSLGAAGPLFMAISLRVLQDRSGN